MRNMEPLNNGVFTDGLYKLVRELRYKNNLETLALAYDLDMFTKDKMRDELLKLSDDRLKILKDIRDKSC